MYTSALLPPLIFPASMVLILSVPLSYITTVLTTCVCDVQVASLKQEVETLNHDNTLLRNALARAQQESAEYASRVNAIDDDTDAAEAIKRQHVARSSAELEELQKMNVRLQAELGCCRDEMAQRHDRWQVCPE